MWKQDSLESGVRANSPGTLWVPFGGGRLVSLVSANAWPSILLPNEPLPGMANIVSVSKTLLTESNTNVSETLPSGERTQPLPSPPPEPPKPKRRKVKRPEDALRYWRKGRGVVHLSVGDKLATFCGREREGMSEMDGQGDGKLCNRCQHTRDNSTWWTL